MRQEGRLRSGGRQPTAPFISKNEAQRRDAAAKALRSEYATRQKAGELVHAETMLAAVEQCGREYREALMNWPARVAPVLAADFQVDGVALAVALDKHVRDFLDQLSVRFALPRPRKG